MDFVQPLPKHVWEKLDWSDPEKNPEINSPSVVSGPYKLVEWKRDQYVIFEGQRKLLVQEAGPNFDRYTIEIVPDQDVAYQKDEKWRSRHRSHHPGKIGRRPANSTISPYTNGGRPQARWSYIGLNMREGFPTHDLNVRYGLNYAIDKDLLTETVMKGPGQASLLGYPETSWFTTPTCPATTMTRTRQRGLLLKAGYTFKDGKMLDKDGQQLKLRLIYGPNTSKAWKQLRLMCRIIWARLASKSKSRAWSGPVFLKKRAPTTRNGRVYLGAWRATIDPHIMYTIWAEQSIPDLNP